MIEVKNLTKRYGDHLAVKGISFTVEEGHIYGFLGPNGAGKSTTMNIITGCLAATDGTVTVDGHDIYAEPLAAKRCIGYLPEQPPLYMEMTPFEYLMFVAEAKGIDYESAFRQVREVIEATRLTDYQTRLIRNLSKGYKQRVGIAQALVGNPEVVILDEPTVGLDPRQIIEIRKLIKELGEDHTVVLSSHILHEVADVCERVVIINQGSIVAQDTLDNLTKNISETSRFRLRVAGPEREVYKLIRDVPGTRTVDQMGVKEPETFDFLVEADRNTDIRRPLFTTLAKNGYPILMLRPMDIELEDIFLQLTTERGEE